MTTVNVHEAKTQLSRLLERAEAGEEIIIARAGKPAAKLTPVAAPATGQHGVRETGFWKGKVWISPDFDQPVLEEVRRPVLDRAAWEEELAFIEQRAQLASQEGRKRRWTRDDLYEERLERFPR